MLIRNEYAMVVKDNSLVACCNMYNLAMQSQFGKFQSLFWFLSYCLLGPTSWKHLMKLTLKDAPSTEIMTCTVLFSALVMW